jgi:hypothetical protein
MAAAGRVTLRVVSPTKGVTHLREKTTARYFLKLIAERSTISRIPSAETARLEGQSSPVRSVSPGSDGASPSYRLDRNSNVPKAVNAGECPEKTESVSLLLAMAWKRFCHWSMEVQRLPARHDTGSGRRAPAKQQKQPWREFKERRTSQGSCDRRGLDHASRRRRVQVR